MPEKRTYRTKREEKPIVIAPNEYGKLPPQALELEEAVLGAIMIEADAYSQVSEILRPECFYKVAHYYIYSAIQSLSLHQQPIDMHTVTEQLRKDGKLEEAGGAYYITVLTAKVNSAAHLEYHARIVMQKFLARELIRVSSEIQTKAFDDKIDVDDLMQDAEGMLFDVAQGSMNKEVIQINPIIEEARERMYQAAQSDGASGVPSGFNALDKITSGWQKSDLIIVAARPAMGKTAFMLSMARNMAVDHNLPIAVFSLEMSNVQLVNRLIMNVCQLDGEKIKNGQLTPHEWQMFDKDITKLMDAPIYVDDTPSLSVGELRTKARRLVKEKNIQCLVVDYLQLMNASGMRFNSREQEVSIISRSLKGLAKELDIPIIALSQLNRGVEGRTGLDGKRPQLSDLRESGAIEQDADMVVFIHRPEYYRMTEDKEGNSLIGLAEIIIAKHRNGRTDDVQLRFKSEHARFLNLDEYDPNLTAIGYQSFPSKMNKETSQNDGDFPAKSDFSHASPPSDETPF